MLLAARAWQFREHARDALAAGDFSRARKLALHAAELHASQSAEDLRVLSQWLYGVTRIPPGESRIPGIPPEERVHRHSL